MIEKLLKDQEIKELVEKYTYDSFKENGILTNMFNNTKELEKKYLEEKKYCDNFEEVYGFILNLKFYEDFNVYNKKVIELCDNCIFESIYKKDPNYLVADDFVKLKEEYIEKYNQRKCSMQNAYNQYNNTKQSLAAKLRDFYTAFDKNVKVESQNMRYRLEESKSIVENLLEKRELSFEEEYQKDTYNKFNEISDIFDNKYKNLLKLTYNQKEKEDFYYTLKISYAIFAKRTDLFWKFISEMNEIRERYMLEDIDILSDEIKTLLKD